MPKDMLQLVHGLFFQALAEVCHKKNPSNVNNVSKIDLRCDSRTIFLVDRYIEFF